MEENRIFVKRVLILMALYVFCAITNPFYAFADGHGEEGEHMGPPSPPPYNPPGSGEGCGSFEDCNGNGAFDLGEPCFEHHGEEGGGSGGP
tara:strand:+ start:286 stop:558 length:273 start_codon:yes stop_codon:yes gene_type:complete